MNEHNWTFLTSHGRVLVYLANHPKTTTREIALKAGITERSVQNVIYDLEKEGYIVRHREGRTNRYMLHPELPMRHSLEQGHTVGDLLNALTDEP